MRELAIITGSKNDESQIHAVANENTNTTPKKTKPYARYALAGLLVFSIYTSGVLYFTYYMNNKDQEKIIALLETQQQLAQNINNFSQKLENIAGDQTNINSKVSNISGHFSELQHELQRERLKVKNLSRRLVGINKQVEW